MTESSTGPLIGTLLRHPWVTVRLRIHAALAADGFGDLQPAHLAVLQTPGPDGRRPGELAAAAMMSKQAMNRLIHTLERLGYVHRTASAEDGRARVVRLTDRGRAATRTIERAAMAIEHELACAWGEDRLERLKGELSELARALR